MNAVWIPGSKELEVLSPSKSSKLIYISQSIEGNLFSISYLARSKKEDLVVLAEELGLTVKKELKVKQLHKLITESPSYDEEFTRELLGSIKEEREKKEQREKEEEREKKEREKEEREEKEQREKQERDREIEREREERARSSELQKLELEVRATSAQPVESRHIPDRPAKIRMHDVMPRFIPKEDDVSLFLVLFERQARIMNIPAENEVAQLISLLPPDIVQHIAREPEEDAKKYEYVKALLLQRFKLSAEKFRQLFNKHQKTSESIWYDFYYELKNYLEGWLNGLNVKTFEQLKYLMLVDQIKKQTSMEFKEHFMDEWTTIISPTEMVKKIEDFEDVRKTIKSKLFATQTERTNKGQFKPRYENFSKKIEHSHYSKLSDKCNDYRHQKDHRQREDTRQRDRFPNKNQDHSFDEGYRPRCFECGSYSHFKPQCPRLKSNEKINCVSSNDDLLETYTISGLVNGFESLFFETLEQQWMLFLKNL
ncbi:hypothetical protein AVEN_190778-1 [Araneus ventricosus]|uniref:CCHC-type domain-containing protein n=1 Tax=Araneus ventricosus TaxID=182803 RepID=A0A4Y2L9E6_ARAVE|nr:hypothetical protein AVEN_190778-1 [Araneus ventricosus]